MLVWEAKCVGGKDCIFGMSVYDITLVKQPLLAFPLVHCPYTYIYTRSLVLRHCSEVGSVINRHVCPHSSLRNLSFDGVYISLTSTQQSADCFNTQLINQRQRRKCLQVLLPSIESIKHLFPHKTQRCLSAFSNNLHFILRFDCFVCITLGYDSFYVRLFVIALLGLGI